MMLQLLPVRHRSSTYNFTPSYQDTYQVIFPTIALLRHAEAEKAKTGMLDFDRPLSQHGREQARHIGAEIRESLKPPLHVLCSPSLRTKQTLEALDLTILADINYYNLLYDGGVDDYLTLLRQEYRPSTLLIGHNPSIAEVAFRLWDKHSSKTYFSKNFPPATLALLSLPKTATADLSGQCVMNDIYHA
ncbi:SixA phosphatase family protein [Bartonella sp. LJL80]